MKLSILYILIYFHYGLHARDALTNSSSSVQSFKEFKLSTEHKALGQCDYCNFLCSNSANNTFVVQTTFNESAKINEPLENGIIAHVYYKCTKPPEMPTGDFPNYRYLKVCGNRVESCNNSLCGQRSSWQSSSVEKIPVLDVNLILPRSVESMKIKISRCDLESMIFLFKINNESIDYIRESQNYKYHDNNIFEAFNLKRLPITLEILFGKVVGKVVFNVTRPTVQNCPTVLRKYCPHVCIGNQMVLEPRCLMKVDNKGIEIESQSRTCKYKTHVLNGGMCELMKSIKDNPCEYICIDLPNCSFMCVTKMGSRYTETGYRERIINNHTRYFGSGNWTIVNIPKIMVYVNECEMSNNLCTSGKGCKDKPVGFQCFNGQYNETECKSLRKKNPFVHCPINKYESIEEMESKYELLEIYEYESKDEIVEKYESASTNKSSYKRGLVRLSNSLQMLFEILSLSGKLKKKNITVSGGSSANGSYKGFNIVESIFQNSFRLLSNNQKYFVQKNSSYYAYGVYVNKTGDTYSIPMTANDTEKDEQYVKFKIEHVTNRSSNKELIATFIRYIDIDPNNEELDGKRLENKTKNKSTSEPYEFMFKNSDIISLSLNQKMNTKVQFKLRTRREFPPSWQFTYDNLCGYLVPGSYWNWSTAGCTMQKTKDNDFYCECNHLSNFAMLTGFQEVNQHHAIIFHYLSIFGGIINVMALILFLIFLLLINSRDKLRLDQLNIAICLLCGCTLFLFGGITSLNDTVCKISAIVTHFLMLAAFVWKLILGVNVVRMITFSRYQHEDWMVKYRKIILGIAYAIPLVIVITSASLFWHIYQDVGDHTCWIQDRRVILYVFLTPIGIILAINLIVLFFIANTLIRNYINTRKTKVNESNELLVFMQLVVSMGLTWVPLCFSVKYLAAMYIWLIFYPLQSLMMFLFVVVINRENREKVSFYLMQRYSSLRSKSTSSTDTKSTLKSRSVHSKSTEPTQSLLSDNDKEKDPYKEADAVHLSKLIDLDHTTHDSDPVC